MVKKDFSTVIGIAVGVGCLLVAYVLEGGDLRGLIGISALLIIFGGTFGALTASFTMKDVFRIPKLLMEANELPGIKEEEIITTIVSLSEKARREGLLSLESDVESELGEGKYDPILKKAIRLVVDGTDQEAVRTILDNEVSYYEYRKKHEAMVFQAAGGFSPTMGIIGTVLGVVSVLGNLSNSEELGPSIALAFIATLYGIGMANLFWLPVFNKLTLKIKMEKFLKELIIEGVLSIQMGENPRIVQDRLLTFIEENKRRKFDEDKG